MFSGYDELINNFKELIRMEKLSHSYLFFGSGGENLTFARALANFLEKEKFEEPKEVLSEFLAVSPSPEKESIGIDKIKDLRYFLWQKPTASLRRVAVVENAQILTIDAQNAALKIVEEPPECGLIIFLAKTTDDLLPTLNSRLQKVYFPITRTNANGNANKREHTNIGQRNNQYESARAEDETEEFFKKSIAILMKDPVKNSAKLKELLSRLVSMKRFNTNKKLQIRSLD